MKPFIYAGLLLSVVAAGAANATEKPSNSNNSNTAVAGAAASSKSNASATGVGVGVGKGGSAKSSATGGNSSNDVAVSQDGDKTDNFGLAIAPPAFSYAPGAAVGECVATESYAVGFPLIGGGWGEQKLVLLPECVAELANVVRNAYKDPIEMAAACQSKFAKNALSDLNVDCDTAPVSEAGE